MGYSPRGHKESDMIERLTLSLSMSFLLKYSLQRSGLRWAGKSLVWKRESLLSILSLG